MVLSTLLFERPAFKHLVCNGLVLAADGKKMSKRLKNYPVRSLLVAAWAEGFSCTHCTLKNSFFLTVLSSPWSAMALCWLQTARR